MRKDAHRLPFTRINGLHAEGTTVKSLNIYKCQSIFLIVVDNKICFVNYKHRNKSYLTDSNRF